MNQNHERDPQRYQTNIYLFDQMNVEIMLT